MKFPIITQLCKLLLQVNYPSQEELLNDVASLMQQMRRFKIDCEAKSDPKTEGKRVKIRHCCLLRMNQHLHFYLPDHEDQVDMGEGWVVPVFCRNRATQRDGGTTTHCLICRRQNSDVIYLSLKYDDIMTAFKTFPFSCHFQLTESEIQERDALSKSIEPRLKSIFLPSHCHSCTLLPHKCLSRNPSWPPPPPRNPSLD